MLSLSNRTLLRMTALLLVLFCTLAAFAQTQASTGQIAGTVRDSAGAVVPKATVKVANPELAIERTVSSNEEGLFRATLLPPGTYTVEVKAPNFSPAKANKVVVEVGREASLNIALKPGSVEQVVEVTETAIQTDQSNSDALLNAQQIQNLPVNGRRFQDLVQVSPTAQTDPSRGQISLSGQRGIYGANVNIDGMDYNQPFFGGLRGGETSNRAFTIPQEAIREFDVTKSGYGAEFGRSTGGVVTAVTKSGTNTWHGSALYLNRNAGLTRSNEFYDTFSQHSGGAQVTPAPTQQQWGGSAGGPIRKDKLFIFAAYEQQKLDNSRRTDFTTLDTLTPTAAQQNTYNWYQGFAGPFVATNNAITGLVRMDYNLNDRNRLNIRYNHSQAFGKNATSAGTSDLFPLVSRSLNDFGAERDHTHTATAQYDSFFGANVSNELRAQYTLEARPRTTNSTVPYLNTSIGTEGARNFLPTHEDDWRYQLADNLTLQRGRHTLKLGGELNFLTAEQTFAFNQFGAYSDFFGGTPAAASAAVLSDLGGNAVNSYFTSNSASYLIQVGNGAASMHSKQVALFIQDSFKLLPNLTLDFGVREDSTFYNQPQATNSGLINQIGADHYPWGQFDPTHIPNAPQNYSPRFGFAWNPNGDGKTVVRGYTGIYSASTPLLLFSDPTANFRTVPNNVSLFFPFSGAPAAAGKNIWSQLQYAKTTCGIANPLAGLANPGQLPTMSAAFLQSVGACMGLSPNPFSQFSVLGVSPNFKNPRSYQYGLGVEHEVRKGWTAGMDFSLINTTNLERNRDLNLTAGTVPASVGGVANLAQRLIFTRFDKTLGSVAIRESSARSLYRSLTVRTNYSHRWLKMNAYYVLSENLSNDDNERDSGGQIYDNVANLKPEYNFSNLDAKHQFVATPIVSLPWGFQVATTMRFRTGRPFNAGVGSDVNGDKSFSDRPYVAPGVEMKRNAFRNYSFSEVNMRIEKTVKVKEQMNFQIYSDFFNLFNAMNLSANGTVANFCTGASSAQINCGITGAPGLTPNVDFRQLRERNPASPNLGQLLTSSDPGLPFQVQFGLRFQF